MKTVLFLAILAAYVAASPPTLTTGDSGELVTAAITLGIAHPPSYPLFCLIGKASSLIPLSNPAWRVGFASMVFSALAALVVFLIVRDSTKKTVIAVACALLYAFLPSVWSQSLVAEVYSLNAFFTALCLFLVLRWARSGEAAYLYLFALSFAVALGNHYPLMLLALPAFAAAFIGRGTKPVALRRLAVAGGFFVAGLLLYLYLPLRSGANPPIDWGNPETLRGFLNNVLRRQYRLLELGQRASLTDMLSFAGNYGKELSGQFGILLLLVLPGIMASWKEDRRQCGMLAFLFLANSLGLVFLLRFAFTPERVSVVNVYYIPSYIACVVWAGWGLRYLRALVPGEKGRLPLYRLAGGALVLAALSHTALSSFGMNNARDNFLAYDYGKGILSFLEKDAVLFIETAGDEALFTTLYLNAVEKVREDVRVYDCWGNVFTNIYGDDFTLLADREKWIERRRQVENGLLLTSRGPAYYLTFSPGNGVISFPLRREGLVCRVMKEGGEQHGATDALWSRYCFRGIDLERKEYQEKEIAGIYYFLQGETKAAENKITGSGGYFRRAFAAGKDISWLANNIGLVHYRRGEYPEALGAFGHLLSLYPGDLPGRYNIALTYKQMGRFDEAREHLERCISLHPLDRDSHKELADVYWDRGMLDAASRIYRTTLKNDLPLAESYAYSGGELYREGKVEQAIGQWRKAILIKEDYPPAYYNIGVACLDIRKTEEAVKMFNRYLRLEPHGPLSSRVRRFIDSADRNTQSRAMESPGSRRGRNAR